MRISTFSFHCAVLLAISSFSMGNLAFSKNTALTNKREHLLTNFECACLEIENALNVQSKAWNEGDLSSFMQTYSRRVDTSYVSKDTQVFGYDAIESRYKKRYGDNRESMGTLTFSDLKFVDLSPNSVICIGHWQVEKKGHEQFSGLFSLVFIKEKNDWKILHDHTS